MAEPFDVTVDPAAGMTLTPSEGIAPETPIANLAPEAQIANLGPVMGPPPQAPIPHVIPPPPPLQADPKNQLAALMALGLAAGMGPRAGGAGAIQGFIQQQAAQQQQRLMQYEFAQKLADEQNLRDEQNYRTSVVLHDQQSNQLRQYLHSVSQQVATAKTPQQYDTMIASFGNMLRMAGYTRLSDNWLRSAVPFVKPSEQQTAVDAFTAWRKNPTNEQLLQQNPAEAGKAVVSVDLNGDGVKENVPLSILADKAGMSFAHDENGGLLAVPKAVGGTSAFDVKLSALMDQFRADNRREPTPAEKNKIVDQAILASKEKPPTVNNFGIDPGAIADAIVSGDQPPDLKGLYRYGAAVRTELAKRNYNLTNATLDWNATQKFISTANGQQQTRMRQAIDNAYHSLDVIDGLASEWRAGRFPVLNRARLAAAKNGVLGPEAQRIATQLDAQITDVTSELANVYMGGNSPTDHALDLARKNLAADWSENQLKALTAQARQNLQIRQNSMRNVEAVTPSGQNPYAPPTTTPGTGGPSSGPKVGERRTIHGQLAEWDGTGWKAVR